jgi:biopolymer transport protein ExbD
MIHFEEPAKRHARVEIIPMIDVMMFLLVFFVLLSINVIPSRGLKADLPQSSAPVNTEPKPPIIVTLARDGALQVGDAHVSTATVAQEIRKQAHGDADLNVVIKGDAGASVQQMVDVMDALREGGIAKVSVATRVKGN